MPGATGASRDGGGWSTRVGRDALIAPQIMHAGAERRATKGRPYGREASALPGGLRHGVPVFPKKTQIGIFKRKEMCYTP